MGGSEENILMSLKVGTGGTGAMREARARGGRAGGGSPGGGRGTEHAGELGGGPSRPGGGGAGVVAAERKVRLGFVAMGVPSSSKRAEGVEVMG